VAGDMQHAAGIRAPKNTKVIIARTAENLPAVTSWRHRLAAKLILV